MSYEYLIRRAYKCGRHGVEGANADIYRTLERDNILYTTALNEIENKLPRSWGEDVKDLAYRNGISAGKVANHIVNAIRKVQSDLNSSLTDEEQEVFEHCKAEMYAPTIEKIQDVIKKAEDIMVEHGLYPG